MGVETVANYIDETKKIIDELVNETFVATQKFISSEIQPLTTDELNKLAFDSMLKKVKSLEKEAGLG